jgi:hypothetical protein
MDGLVVFRIYARLFLGPNEKGYHEVAYQVFLSQHFPKTTFFNKKICTPCAHSQKNYKTLLRLRLRSTFARREQSVYQQPENEAQLAPASE